MMDHYYWESEYEEEIKQAKAALKAGNEGRARVCARRAAGHVIGEYFRRQGFNPPSSSAYYRLQYLRSSTDIPAEVREAAHHLLLRITPEHTLPVDTDLVEKARLLKIMLIEKEDG